MGILNFLGNFAWGCQIPCLVGDTKNTEGVPKSLGYLTQRCQIFGGTRSPMTQDAGLVIFLHYVVCCNNSIVVFNKHFVAETAKQI